jgi:MFS family permease
MAENESKRAKIRKPLPRSVWLLSIVSFFADVSSEMIYPLMPLFVVGILGASKTHLGIIEGAAVFLVAAMSAWAGFRSDRGGRRVPWIRWGYGLPVAGKLVMAAAWNWPSFLGGRLLDRFGKGLRGAPRDGLLAGAVTQAQRGRAFGLHRAFDTAGALTGVLLAAFLLWWLSGSPLQDASEAASGGSLAPAWVYRLVLAIGAALGLCAVAISFLIREPADLPENHADANVRLAGDPSSLNADCKPDRASVGSTLRLGLPKTYWLALSVLALFSLANSSDAFLLLKASELGHSPWVVVLIYAVYNVTYSALSYPVGALSDRWGRWRMIEVGWAIYAAAYAGVACLSVASAWGLWPLMALYGAYMALTDGVGKALIADCAPRDFRGRGLGIFHAVMGVTTLGASLLAGLAWDRWGSTAPFLLGAGFATIALVVVALLRFRQRYAAT